MIYVVGIVGFFLGFFLGQVLLLKLLKDVSSEELLESSSLRWKYGTLNWLLAVLGSASAVHLYKLWLLSS